MWTITQTDGSGTDTFEALGLDEPQIDFRVMGVSTARVMGHRDLDSAAAWWTYDSIVTIYRDDVPYFTGRVQECPDSATPVQEVRTLVLADAWQDLSEVIYRESWGIGTGSYLYPRCILGLDDAGAQITTGEQIEAVIDYAITQGVSITKGTIDAGYQLWPSEARNQSCESIITNELQFHPDWVAWLDHSTEPPTFHARAKADLDTVTIDIADETVESQRYAEVKRTVPRGVSIVYESASTIDGEVYRTGYVDEAGTVTGRRVIRAMFDLEGVNVSIQKSRIQTRTLPTNAATMTAYFKAKFPELAAMPDGAFSWSAVSFALAPTETAPDPINTRATLISVASAADLPRELVYGSIEDWMRVKVGGVVMTYTLKILGAPTEAQRKILDNFEGTAKTITITATNATTKIYKGITSFTAGEGRPTGLAAAVYAAATEQQYEGHVTTVEDEVSAGRWHGKKLVLMNGATTLMPGAVIHSASVDVETGKVTVDFGPMPYLSAGDFLDLQRILNRRKVTWYSLEERTSNTLGATDNGSAVGDAVGGFNFPQTTAPPGGGLSALPPFWPVLNLSEGAFTFTITDGHVIQHKGGNGNTDALDIHYPTGLGTLGGARTAVSITAGQQISIVVTVDKEGDFYSAALTVEAENTDSINPDPTASGGAGENGVFHYKIAVLRAAVGDTPAYLDYYLAGSHINLRQRGHNLDMHVFIIDISNGEIQPSSDHYLCWRNGDYVGKFGSEDTLPGYVGTLDNDSVTYLQEFYP